MKAIKATIIIALFFVLTGVILAMGKHNEEDVLADSLKTLQGLDTTRLEKYKAEVIIDAKWGSGPGEFGVIKEACGIAPNCYTIDKTGIIYIIDPANARVQIFDANGKYLREVQYTEKNSRTRHLGWEAYDIALDANENVYILFYINVGRFPGQSVEIRKYSSTGEFVDSFPIPLELLGPTTEEIEMGMPLLVIKTRLNTIAIENNDIKVEGWFEPDYLGTDKGETRQYSLVKGGNGLPKESIIRSYKIMPQEVSVKFPHKGNFAHLNTEKDIFYFTSYEQVGEKDDLPVYEGLILEYDDLGKLNSIIRYPFYRWGQTIIEQLFFDDKSKRIYCFTNDDEGVRLLVYTKI